MQHVLELIFLLVAMVFAWKRTSAWHIKQGRGKIAARIGALGSAITVFVIVMGLIMILDPPPGFPSKATQSIPASPSAPTKVLEHPISN